MVEFKPESMSCVRNVLEVWPFKGKEFKWKHHFICFIPIQQDVYGVREHYGLTFSARKKITIVLVAAERSGRDAPLHVFFFYIYISREEEWNFSTAADVVRVQSEVWMWSGPLTDTKSSCQTQDPPAPRAPGSSAVSSAHVRAVDSSREGNLKTVLDSSATQRNTVQGGRDQLKYPSISHKQVRLFIICCSFF